MLLFGDIPHAGAYEDYVMPASVSRLGYLRDLDSASLPKAETGRTLADLQDTSDRQGSHENDAPPGIESGVVTVDPAALSESSDPGSDPKETCGIAVAKEWVNRADASTGTGKQEKRSSEAEGPDNAAARSLLQRNLAPSVYLTVFLPDRSPLRVRVRERATVHDCINEVLRAARKEQGMPTTLRALPGDAWCYELRMHEQHGEPDLDFPALERDRRMRHFSSAGFGANEYCLVEVEGAVAAFEARRAQAAKQARMAAAVAQFSGATELTGQRDPGAVASGPGPRDGDGDGKGELKGDG